ncbi:MAG: hypothetical protein KC994_26590, partial [Candidatus Omnitrophica bacterium]|nr:hypothetical protein [Candidatus Omnitrophota bacterium]
TGGRDSSKSCDEKGFTSHEMGMDSWYQEKIPARRKGNTMSMRESNADTKTSKGEIGDSISYRRLLLIESVLAFAFFCGVMQYNSPPFWKWGKETWGFVLLVFPYYALAFAIFAAASIAFYVIIRSIR